MKEITEKPVIVAEAHREYFKKYKISHLTYWQVKEAGLKPKEFQVSKEFILKCKWISSFNSEFRFVRDRVYFRDIRIKESIK